MKKSTVLILAFLLIAAASPAFGAESLQNKLVPEEAKWVIHVDVEQFAKTRFKEILMESADFPLEKEILGIEKTANIDFFKDISAVTAIGMNSDDDEPVIAFSGNLNKDHLLTLLKEKEEPEEIMYGNFLIYSWDGSDYGVFITDRLLLISENKNGLEKVLDTFSGKGKNISGTALDSRLKKVSRHTFLIAAAVNISELVEDEDDFASLILQKSDSAFFTASEQNKKMSLTLTLQADSQETAKNLGDMATGLKAFLAMNEKIDPNWDLLKNMTIGIQGNTIVLESESPADGLAEVLMGLKK